MPGRDVRLFADVVSNCVEIMFGSKDLSEENITKSFIKKFTDESFVIEEFESTDGETAVIVRFEDPGEAKKFVREVSSFVRGGGDSLIRGDEIVRTCDPDVGCITTPRCPPKPCHTVQCDPNSDDLLPHCAQGIYL